MKTPSWLELCEETRYNLTRAREAAIRLGVHPSTTVSVRSKEYERVLSLAERQIEDILLEIRMLELEEENQ